MEKQFIPYEQALELKELGFEEKTFDIYSDGVVYNFSNRWIIKPTRKILWQQAFDWFRDVMLLDNFIIPYWFIDGEYKVKKYTYSIEPSNRFDEYFDCDSDQYDTYEEARLECLKRLIELCEM